MVVAPSTHQKIVSALALSIAIAGCADSAGIDYGNGTARIVNGAETTGDEPVVAFVYQGQQFCTGTLVSKRVVVTAAHCLPPNIDLPISAIEIYFGDSVYSGVGMPAVDGIANPTWNSSIIAGDIGVVALNANAPVAPAIMGYGDLSALQSAGDEAKVVGFGITDAQGSGNGVKRMGMATIERITADSIFLDPGPASTCNGDSGGPLFITLDGVEQFVGIHSRSDCAAEAIAERVDIHVMDFIQPFIEEHEGAGSCEADGFCAANCRAPDPDCPCANDGMCTDMCTYAEADLDCAGACGEDGQCNEDCVIDADCQPEGSSCEQGGSCEDEPSGCSAGSSGSGAPVSLMLLALVALVTRRTRRA